MHMRNLADAIESFIIGELLRDHEDALLVQRNELAERLRRRETPVAARIAHERLLLCLRTLRPEEYDELVRAVAESDR